MRAMQLVPRGVPRFKIDSAVPTKYWPCKSNSVCLGSSPRAQNRVGAFWAFNRVLAAGPVHPVYSSEPHSMRCLAAEQPLTAAGSLAQLAGGGRASRARQTTAHPRQACEATLQGQRT